MLTDKEEIFATAIADGYSQSDAYILAYNPKTKNANSIAAMACRIANKEDVKERINAFIDRKSDKYAYNDLLDKNKRINLIYERIQYCIDNKDENNVVKYIDMLNKLAGDYKNITVKQTDIKPLANMSIEELNKLLDKDPNTIDI